MSESKTLQVALELSADPQALARELRSVACGGRPNPTAQLAASLLIERVMGFGKHSDTAVENGIEFVGRRSPGGLNEGQGADPVCFGHLLELLTELQAHRQRAPALEAVLVASSEVARQLRTYSGRPRCLDNGGLVELERQLDLARVTSKVLP